MEIKSVLNTFMPGRQSRAVKTVLLAKVDFFCIVTLHYIYITESKTPAGLALSQGFAHPVTSTQSLQCNFQVVSTQDDNSFQLKSEGVEARSEHTGCCKEQKGVFFSLSHFLPLSPVLFLHVHTPLLSHTGVCHTLSCIFRCVQPHKISPPPPTHSLNSTNTAIFPLDFSTSFLPLPLAPPPSSPYPLVAANEFTRVGLLGASQIHSNFCWDHAEWLLQTLHIQ